MRELDVQVTNCPSPDCLSRRPPPDFPLLPPTGCPSSPHSTDIDCPTLPPSGNRSNTPPTCPSLFSISNSFTNIDLHSKPSHLDQPLRLHTNCSSAFPPTCPSLSSTSNSFTDLDCHSKPPPDHQLPPNTNCPSDLPPDCPSVLFCDCPPDLPPDCLSFRFSSPDALMNSVTYHHIPLNTSPNTPQYTNCPPYSTNISSFPSKTLSPPPCMSPTLFCSPDLSPAPSPPLSPSTCNCYLSPSSASQDPTSFTHVSKPKCFSQASMEAMTPRCRTCSLSVESQLRMEQNQQLSEEFLDSLSRFEDWLQGAQITAALPKSTQSLYSEAKLSLHKCEVLLRNMREKLQDLENLNRQYWRLSQAPQTLLPSALRSRMQEVNECWDILQREVEAKHWTLKLKVQQREEFEMDKEEMRLWLAEMDMALSSVEYIYSGNSTEKMQQLQAFQEHVRSNMERLDGLFQQGGQLMEGSEPQDAKILEEEMTELGFYCQEIFTRLSRYQKRLVSTKLVFEDDLVLDGELDVLSDGSSDVFLEFGAEESAAFAPQPTLAHSNLNPCVSEAPVKTLDLEWDPLGDVGRSSSNDGQESFHTAPSVQRKGVRREFSQTSLSSVAWTSDSKVESQRDIEHLGTIATTWDTNGLEEKRVDGNMKDTNVLPHAEEINGLGQVPPGHDREPPAPSLDLPDPVQRTANSIPSEEHQVDISIPGQMEQMTLGPQAVDRWLKQNQISQRRRQGQTGKVKSAKNPKRKPTKQPKEVSILIERGCDVTPTCPDKTSSRVLNKLRLWAKRLASLSLLVLFLGGSLLILPMDHPSCVTHKFAWSLMLTYVNGPPPT
ncbi:uncharacterized protein O3C94_015872 isoform 1-T2 [Discoglossus pictus]